MPSREVHQVRLATLTDVARALGPSSRYHFGVPDRGLVDVVQPGLFDVPQFAAEAPLRTGDVYVDTLQAWAGAKGEGTLTERIRVLEELFKITSRARYASLLATLGYVPLAWTVPRLGGPVTYSPHGRLIFNGHFGESATAAVEEFSFGLSYDVVGPDVGAMPNTLPPSALQGALDAMAGYWTTAGNVTRDAWLDGVAYARIGSDGKITSGQYQRLIDTTPARGETTPGAVTPPLSVAIAVTLDAQGPRGGRFGRCFLPAPGHPLTLGTLPQSIAQAMAGTFRSSLGSINTALSAAVDGDVELVVASGRGSGENRPVREVRVGRVPDTIRSRRRSLDEAYAVLPFQAV